MRRSLKQKRPIEPLIHISTENNFHPHFSLPHGCSLRVSNCAFVYFLLFDVYVRNGQLYTSLRTPGTTPYRSTGQISGSPPFDGGSLSFGLLAGKSVNSCFAAPIGSSILGVLTLYTSEPPLWTAQVRPSIPVTTSQILPAAQCEIVHCGHRTRNQFQGG